MAVSDIAVTVPRDGTRPITSRRTPKQAEAVMKKLLFLAALIGAIIAIAKRAKLDREQWEGLTEDDVRSRLDERLPNQIPDDKREMIADKIVSTMKDRGALADDVLDMDDTIDLSDPAGTPSEAAST